MTYGGMDVYLHALTLALDAGGQLHVPAALSSVKELIIPVTGWVSGRSGRGGKEKNIPAPARNRTPVTLLTGKSGLKERKPFHGML
jgi:hypothetical protein